MGRENIFAYTVPGCNYPAYLSLNVDDKGKLEITVRSKASDTGDCGPTACITLTEYQERELARALFNRTTVGTP